MDVHERLAEAVRMMKERQKLLNRLETTRNMTDEERNRCNELKQQLISENRDVERLDGITLHNLWYSLRGTKEIVKRKEQEEYLAAKMKFDAANTSLATLESDLQRLERELDAIGDLEAEYQQAVQLKEEFLLRSGGPNARHLFELAEQLGKLKAEEKELEEALEAGTKAEEALSKVDASLGNAQGWGVVDILGGGLITTAIKHSHIDNARNGIDKAQQMLLNFQRELADVKATDTIEIGGIVTAADFLLDGVVFDVIVQSQINTAQDRTLKIMHKVQTDIKALQEMQKQNCQKSMQLEQERKYIIENAGMS